MGGRIQRFHVGVGHQEEFHVPEGLRPAEILDVGDAHRNAFPDERQGEAVEVGHPRIIVTVVKRETLEHQGIAHEDGDARRPVRARIGHRHVLEGVRHDLHHGRKCLGNADPFVRTGGFRIEVFIDPVRPGHDLVIGNLRIQELGRIGGLVVPAEVFPVPGRIFDGVRQEPDAAAGRGYHRRHAAVFQVGGLEDPLLALAPVPGRDAGGSGPYLRDITVHAVQRGQGGLGAHDFPLGIVQEGVRGNVTLDVAAQGTTVLLGVGKRLFQRTIIQMILQFGGKVGRFRGFVLRTPGSAVTGLPFALEGVAVAAGSPEFGLFQEDGVHTRVDDTLDVTFLEIGQVVLRGDDIGHVLSVPEGVAGNIDLALVPMGLAVPFAGEIIGITAPGDAGHEVGRIATLPPGSQAFLQRNPAAHAVHHDGIGPGVDGGTPALGGLDGRFRRLFLHAGGAGGGEKEKEDGFTHIVGSGRRPPF